MSRFGLLVLAVVPSAATAQAATVGPIASAVGHQFLTDRAGWLLNVELPLLERQVYMRLQFENSGGTGAHVGTVCDPPSAPGCADESIDDRSEFWSTSLAVPIHLIARSRVALALVPHLTGGRVWARMTGRTTGQVLETNRNFRGVGIGTELHLRAAAQSPFSLVAGARHATLFPVRRMRPDVVQPLSREFSDNAAYVALRVGR